MKRKIFAHVPYNLLGQNLEFILANGVSPEIFLSGEALDTLIPGELAAIADTLRANEVHCMIHAPFMDLNPGSVEKLVREATLHRLDQTLNAATVLKPDVIVFHPGYDRWRYGESQDKWLRHSIDSWRMVLDRAEKIGCIVAVENIFEEEPSTLRALFETVDHPQFRHCFDVGHWNLFTRITMPQWFHELGRYIAETHIHDNFGQKDDHLPVGEGAIDFELFFSLMDEYAPQAVYTIEAHSREKVQIAIRNLTRYVRD